MACLRGPPMRSSHKKLKKHVILKQMRKGLWVATSWPTRKSPITPTHKAQMSQMSEWAYATKIAWIGDQLQAKEIAKDSGWYPRDVQIRAFNGSLIEWYDREGNHYIPAKGQPVPPPITSPVGWRLLLTAPSGAGAFAGQQFGMCTVIGGDTVCPGNGFGFASQSYSGDYGPEHLFTGHAGGIWSSTNNQCSQYVGFVFTTGIDIAEIYWQDRTDVTGQSPHYCRLQASKDTTTGFDGAWYDIADLTFTAWSPGQIQRLSW